MKQIIIFLLIVILGFVAYDFYKDWQRFHAPTYFYTTEAPIDLNYHDQSVVWDYEEAIAELNSYVKLQWTAEDIDVRAPEDQDEATLKAVAGYSKKQAKVAYFENILSQSASYKSEGWNDDQIRAFENNSSSPEIERAQHEKELLLELFNKEIEESRKLGSRGTLIYEVQKILIFKGYEIPHDGVFAQITSTALADFESKNNFFPDGKLDLLTFVALIN